MIRMELHKHRNCTDVALMPLHIRLIPEKGVYKIRARWFNIVNPKNVFDLGIQEWVDIKVEDMKNWKLYEQV